MLKLLMFQRSVIDIRWKLNTSLPKNTIHNVATEYIFATESALNMQWVRYSIVDAHSNIVKYKCFGPKAAT